jgi:ribosomal protein S18 acetylase RimI-like enzyme
VQAEVLIRALAPDDAPAFLALRLRGLREHPEAFSSSYEEERESALADVERRLEAAADAAVFGAHIEGALVGVTGVRREGRIKLAHKAHIWGVYVAPEARGRGIGERLLRLALAFARDRLGVRQVNLGVNAGNAAAVALYRKLGFAEYGLERGFMPVGGVLHDQLMMVWRPESG